jgi:isopentenyl-diphosphate delta-isomerase
MDPQVSFDDEKLIVVDETDKILDYKTKAECHEGNGILHRAFSLFIFNSAGKLLIQKRSDQKMLWPLFWSNSCCSHPRKGESYKDSVYRRLKEELGISTPLKYMYKFIYRVPYKDIGSEYELCSVYVGSSDEKPLVNHNEIADWKFIDAKSLDKEFEQKKDDYSPWFRMEWKRLREEFQSELDKLIN